MVEEPKKQNDLFFTCSLVEYIARETKNTKKTIVDKLGYGNIEKIYTLADVYHCENIEAVCDEFVQKCKIAIGNYDVVANCRERVPTYWEIGRVYQRLISMITSDESKVIENVINVLNSWIIEKIDNYNSSMYYENPDYIYACYVEGKVL